MNTVPRRLTALRQAMKAHRLDAWIVPSADPHLSEYLPDHWQGRRWLSGFTGSVGTLVVLADEAGLWVDSRYWEQASAQLADTGIALQKLMPGAPTHVDALVQRLAADARVGVAPDMLSLAARRQLQQAFADRRISLCTDQDLLDALWADRPLLPAEPVVVHDPAFVSEDTASKLSRIRSVMQDKGAAWHLVSSLDDVAWITNLRGSDVSYNPVFLAHLLISPRLATLFVDEARLTPAAREALAAAGIQVVPYDQVDESLARVTGTLLLDPAKVAVSTLNKLPSSVRLIESLNPAALFKALKSPEDIAYVREAMVQDGVALCGFFAEFEARMARGERTTELDIDEMLRRHRSARPHFVSESFGTIAGFNANGALPHYSATQEAHSVIEGDGLLLIDSGAQYTNGTTDITRVVPVGKPSAAQMRDNTLVLKAHIAMSGTVFPEGIAAPMLDAICRKPMWQMACDYGHGTGHGVGYFLNVHEGPQVLAYRAPVHEHSAMKVGMVTSIEPGIYRPGQWGVRIENLVVNQPLPQPPETAFGRFLYFEPLTLCPIDTRLMDTAMMTAAEVDWVNAYHALVRERLLPHVEGPAREWLMARTEAI